MKDRMDVTGNTLLHREAAAGLNGRQRRHVILVVDDEPDLLKTYAELLDYYGYEVVSAGNGNEALEVLAHRPVDLVVSDLRMPGMDGMMLLRSMGEAAARPPVVFLTAYGTVENAVQCLQMGAADYLLKPFNIQQFIQKVDQVLSSRRTAESRRLSFRELEDFSESLRGHRDTASVLKELLRRVRRSLEPDGMALFLQDEAGSLTPRFLWGEPLRRDKTLCRDLAGVAGRSRRSGFALRFDGNGGGNGNGDCGCLSDFYSSVAVTPIAGMQGILGVLALARSKNRPDFSESDQRLLNLFVRQAAPSIEVIQASNRVENLNFGIVMSYVQAVEAKDIYTRGHSERVSGYAMLLGVELGLPERDIAILQTAGLLHDIGKIGIPDHILNKPDELTEQEYLTMKRHPVVAREILSQVSSLEAVIAPVYHHHEWFDGSGYPSGYSGESIPYLARVLSVVDGYEALTSTRSYHSAASSREALGILRQGASVQWDPVIVETWAGIVEREKMP